MPIAGEIASEAVGWILAESGRDPTPERIASVAVEAVVLWLAERHDIGGRDGIRQIGQVLKHAYDEVDDMTAYRWFEYRNRRPHE